MSRQNPKVRAVDEKNFYELGELLVINIRKFGGSAQITDALAEERFKEDADVLRGVQDLLLPEHRDALKALDTIKNETHSYIGRNSVPHPLPSFYFIMKGEKKSMVEYITRKENEYKELAQFFADNWEGYEKEYKKKKPNLYRPEKYPKKVEILSRFIFDAKWYEITPSDPNGDELRRDIDEMKRYVLATMKKTIIDRMDVLVKSCTDGKVSQATLDSIESNIFSKYDRLFAGFIDSTDMKKAVSDMKEYLEGTDAEMLRTDEVFKEMIADKAKQVSKTVEKIKVDKGDRQLLF